MNYITRCITMEITDIKKMYFEYCCNNNEFHTAWANRYNESKDIIIKNQNEWKKEFQSLKLDLIIKDDSIQDFKRHHNEYLLSIDTYDQVFSLLIALGRKPESLSGIVNYYFYKDIKDDVLFQNTGLKGNIVDFFYNSNDGRLMDIYLMTKKIIINDLYENNKAAIENVKKLFLKYNYNFCSK